MLRLEPVIGLEGCPRAYLMESLPRNVDLCISGQDPSVTYRHNGSLLVLTASLVGYAPGAGNLRFLNHMKVDGS